MILPARQIAQLKVAYQQNAISKTLEYSHSNVINWNRRGWNFELYPQSQERKTRTFSVVAGSAYIFGWKEEKKGPTELDQ